MAVGTTEPTSAALAGAMVVYEFVIRDDRFTDPESGLDAIGDVGVTGSTIGAS